MSETQPAKIGKYEIECLLGEGAMGVVYRASDPMIGRRVAIKVMADAVAQDDSLRGRFLREAQAAGSLQHPNVVTIYDFGEVDDHLFIAMEYVEGNDVSELLQKDVALPVDTAVELVLGVLHGLSYAHKRGIVHRDIKPANIRVDAEGKARLMDFGVAHLSSSDMTSTGVLLGTPTYMAPEQISGAPVTPQADLFSVGAVLYELLTHTRPFKGDTLHALMYQILSQPPRPIEEISPEVPPALIRVVMRALEKDPANRYATALEMADDLSRVLTTAISGTRRSTVSLRATIDSALSNQRESAEKDLQAHGASGKFRRFALIGGGVLVAAALLVVAARTVTNRDGAERPEASASSVGPDTQSLVPAANAPPGEQQVAPPVGAPASASPREIASALGVQRAALEVRRRASEMGATAAQLRDGDVHNRAGESSIDSGRVSDARNAFSRAAAAWTITERTVRQAALNRSAADRIASSARSAPAVPRDTQSAEPPPITPPQRAIPVAPVMPPAAAPPASNSVPEARDNPSVAIASVIAAYARALDSRDIGELRRVYPTMTAPQRRAFEDFFRSTRSLQANLAVSDLKVEGATAEANVSGTYVFVTTSGASERQPVKFRALLRRDGATWALTAVR